MSAATESAELRRALVHLLRVHGNVRSARVAAAFEAIPREAFVAEFAAEAGLAAVYADSPIVVKRDANGIPISSSSQPAIMAAMLELLEVDVGARVLEVGAGTGYNAALLAHLAGPSGSVTAVEVDDDLGEGATAALRAVGSGARVVVADGRLGWAAGAPYDRIIVTASSSEIPKAWLDQLVPDGVLVMPLRATSGFALQLVVAFRRGGAQLRSDAVVPGGFMGLRDPGGPAPEMRNVMADGETGVVEILEEWARLGYPVDGFIVTAGFDDERPVTPDTRVTADGWIAYERA